ncbi:MAG: glycosyltransferase family 4 protein [Proteobacteria bacterium]|nr:glycosyltransferase family 4 protein [Pseudomonadota bacterium]
MRVLCIYRHYWPDVTPYARLLRAIAEHLVSEGHAVTVFTGQPGYNDVRQRLQPWRETLGGVEVIRVRLPPERKRFLALRLLGFLGFLGQALAHSLWNRRRYDLALFNMHPPLLMGVTGLAIRCLAGIPFIYHCQDIHPESSRVVGRIRNPHVYRLLRRIDAAVCQAARLNVVLSEDMRDTLLERGVPPARIEVLNNFSLDHYDNGAAEVPPPLDDAGEKFQVLFAGNLGDFQGLDSIVEAAHRLAENPAIRFVFMGEGLAKHRLVEAAGGLVGRTVFFIDFQPVEVAHAAMARADLGLISLAPKVYRVAFPSKTMMYLSAGCPVLAIVEPDSNLARTIRDQQLGYVAPAADAATIASTMEGAWRERSRWTAPARLALQERAEQLYGRAKAMKRWARIVSKAPSPPA